MKELFIPFNIPNLETIQKELLEAIAHDFTQEVNPHAFTYKESYMKSKCPVFMSWFLPRLKLPVRLYRYYITPPRSNLPIHIDGTDPTVPFALNIPVAGTKNTLLSFYSATEDNVEIKPVPGYISAILPIDDAKLTRLADLEVNTPYVINNSILHGVTNDTDEHRIMFTIRWPLHKVIGRTVEECIDLSDLLC